MIHPTRTNLLLLRERAASVTNSVAILKARRQALIRHFLDSVQPFVRSRDALRSDYGRALAELRLATGHEGSGWVESLAANSERAVGVEISDRNVMGLRYRELVPYGPFERSPAERNYDYSATTPHLEEAIHGFEKVLASMLEIETIALLGTDRDAVRLALLSALAGLDVRVHDERPEALDAAFRELRKDVEQALAYGRLDRDQRQRIFDGILFTPELGEAVVGADLVFAAGPLDVAAARELLATLAGHCRATTLLATRLDPGEVAGAIAQPGRVVALTLEPDDGIFPRVTLGAGPATTAHAKERGERLAQRLNRASGQHR